MYVFVGGTPAAGKSYTVNEFIKDSGLDILCVNIDNLRGEFRNDPDLRYWADFFWNKGEEEYWKNTSYEVHTRNLIKQSEAFWPKIKELIEQVRKDYKGAIFEGVNLLPHLVKEYKDIPALFLIQEDPQVLLERIKEEPRWGKDLHLQQMEAKYFVEYDARFIKEETVKYGFPVINDPKILKRELSKLFSR